MIHIYRPPIIVRKLFPGIVWENQWGGILLTFDDGPVPGITERILERLAKHNIRALFFVVGEQAKKYPELCSEILRAGHEIGNHTEHHKRMTRLGKQEAIQEIQSVQDFFLKEFSLPLRWFRPPHGRFNLSTVQTVEALSLRMMMWTLLTYDFENSAETVMRSYDKYLRKDSIVVLHNSVKSEQIILQSIDALAERALAAGLSIGRPAA